MKSQSRFSKVIPYVLTLFFGTLLIPNMVHAKTFYVDTTGSDSSTGTEAAPFQTIKKGISSLSAGDTLKVNSGTYAEGILSWTTPVPSGTSWDNAVTVMANPKGSVTIKPPQGTAFFWLKDPSTKYLIIDGFIIDGQNEAHHGIKLSKNVTYVRVQNGEIKNSKYSGVLVTIADDAKQGMPVDTYHEFINLNVHHNGSSTKDHGFYIETSYNLVEFCDVHSNAGNGGKFFQASLLDVSNHNIARYNTFHDNGQSLPNDNTFGWLLASGDGNEAYGNVAYNNSQGFAIGNRAENAFLYNNISYNNRIYGIHVYGAYGGSTNAKVFNNTVYNNDLQGIAIVENAKDTSVKNNISYSNGPDGSSDIWLQPNKSPGTIVSNNLTSDPAFVNASTYDFKLQPWSAAIDEGITIPEVSKDFFDLPRPQGTAYDIGAVENEDGAASPPSPSPPTNLQFVIK